MKRTRICNSWECPQIRKLFRAGVSLHSHTSASSEQLSFLRGFQRQFPIIPSILKLAAGRHFRATGEVLDLDRAGWHPPLDAGTAFDIEAAQIRGFGLDPFVSLTDHDVMSLELPPGPPISVEWTVPFGATFFHIGAHNLPPESWNTLRGYTSKPTKRALAEVFEFLDAQSETLIVFNHPMWDEARIGEHAHQKALSSLLRHCGDWIHAIELNGLRPHRENVAAARLAHAYGKPLVSGGDRHGAEPNANINLTNARTFAEFVEEVRHDAQSTILFLPQYREPVRLRWLQTAWDIVRSYPGAPEHSRHWSGRFFYRCADGIDRSVAEIWKTTRPPVLSQIFAMLRLAMIPPLRPALRLALADRGESAGFETWRLTEQTRMTLGNERNATVSV